MGHVDVYIWQEGIDPTDVILRESSSGGTVVNVTITDNLVITDTVNQTTTYSQFQADIEELLDQMTLVTAYARGPPDEVLGLTDSISVTVTSITTDTVMDIETLSDPHNMHLGLLHHRSLVLIGSF